jgi:juvenile hormone acid methyltransferase
MHQMFQMLRPEGEMLLVFLASNPIFSMYERMAEKTEWAEYMKVICLF